MKLYDKKPYISLLLPAMALAGCADDPLYSVDPVGNPDAITFSANTVDAVVDGRTRGEEKPIYDPLVLTDAGGASTLYLHTYETNRIGFEPGDGCEVETRGNQVASAADLLKFHENFKVLANKKNDGSNYLGWVNTHIANSGGNVWYTDRTEYWPAAETLSFYAISPSSEFSNLTGLSAFSGEISFDYTARKGAAGSDKDAEAQQDLLLSAYECNKTTHDGKAPLNFSHALSAVKFAIRDVLGGEVVNIKIGNVKSAGHCTFEKNQEGEYQVIWSEQTGEDTFSQNFNYTIASDHNVSVSDTDKDEVLNEKMPEKTFMMIPQMISDGAYIEVTLKRSANVVAAGAKEQITVKGNIKDNLVTEWKPGHEYIYTISTSKDNWVYVFDVKGNEAEGFDNLYVYSPNDTRFQTLDNTAYYSVASYRYRANDQSKVENLPWDASFEGSESYDGDALYEGKWIDPEKWITDKHTNKFSGNGSKESETHNIEMYPHYLTTDWEGDKTMQNNKPYKQSMLSKGTPYDLSTFGGDKTTRTTANCYIVDRGGWYSLPLVYGNAVKNGGNNTGSYQCSSTSSTVLKTLRDYQDKNITGSYISGGKSAALVWQDAYNMISEVELVKLGGEDMIRFYVDKENLQQGNAVVALKDQSGTIMWSWHIWATEHWLDSNGKPNALSSSAEFSYKLNPVTLVRESGDALISRNLGGRTFYMAPYNLGWCDPKNVIYLKRKSRMDFKQYNTSEKTKVSATASLDIIQQGETVNYKIGNNTYYQWGRKDPQVGFVDREKHYKTNFGPTPFKVEDNASSTIADGIKNPHLLYVHTKEEEPPAQQQDWANPSYINLWNNRSDVRTGTTNNDALYYGQKTVYDPCPVGYMVPNAGIWRIIGTNNTDNYFTQATFLEKFNGELDRKLDAEPDGIYVYKVYGNGNKDSKESLVYLIPTGNRWYSNGHPFPSGGNQDREVRAGENFNLRIYYGWSSRRHSTSETTYQAYCCAIGIDGVKNYDYYLRLYFLARRSMGRPVRPIRGE